MTKERLEELIKQKATIWDNADHFEIKLNPEQYSITELFGETVLWYQPKDEPSGYDWSWELGVLREDVNRAKWEHDMYAERTERFEPPMWEEFEKGYDFYFYIKDTPYAFHVNKDLQCIEFSRDFMHNIFMKKGDEANKENYEKACGIVRNLFKGEK